MEGDQDLIERVKVGEKIEYQEFKVMVINEGDDLYKDFKELLESKGDTVPKTIKFCIPKGDWKLITEDTVLPKSYQHRIVGEE